LSSTMSTDLAGTQILPPEGHIGQMFQFQMRNGVVSVGTLSCNILGKAT
jgi:hypothetical protein